MEKFRILVVEDEEDVRTVERWALATKYEVVEACDGLDALEKLERAEPDFVILDVMMPLMDGFEVCRSIRKHPRFGGMPVLFLSAKREKKEIQEGYGAGANLYLTKPFDPDRLVKNVDYHLQESGVQPRPKRYTIEQLSDPDFHEAPAPTAEAAPAPTEPPEESAPVEKVRMQEAEIGLVPTATTRAEPARPRVMVVDDQKEVVEMLSLALNRDFEITAANNGLQAVERIIVAQPDLIVLDAMLPKMSGYQLCVSLRRNRNFQNTPIIFISAKSTPRDQDYCMRLGANDFFAKPFDPELLRRRLLGYVNQPGFQIRPKKFTLEQIQAREEGRREDREIRQQEVRRQRGAADLQRFIDREMSP